MIFPRRKKKLAALESSFGQIKSESFNFDLIKRYFDRKDNTNSFQVLSDETLTDLDFDLFFAYADRTSSKVGQQFLYNSMRSIDWKKSRFDNLEEAISYFKEHPKERLNAQYLLDKLNHKDAYYLSDLFQGPHIEIPKWFFVIPLLSITAISSTLLSFFFSKYLLIFLALLPVNLIIHYLNKKRVNIYVSSVPMLLVLNSVAKKLIKIPILKTQSEKAKSSSKNIDQLKQRMSFFKLEQKVDSDLEVIYWFLMEAFKISFLIEPLLIQNVVKKLETKRKEIEDVFIFVGAVDQAISITSLRTSKYTSIPTIDQSLDDISLINFLHPLVSDCVPNSVLSAKKPYLLTGSNMSGKTTFIRAIGLNLLSGITLNTTFCDSCSFPPIKLHSVIQISDDISNASSYFNQEVISVKTLIEESSKDHINVFLLDELFKGTNAIERISSAKAILSYLNKFNNFIFVSTHDIELTDLLKNEYDLYHFQGSLNNDVIHYDYKLKVGAALTSNAIDILKINGYPESVISESEQLVQKIIRDKQG